MEAVMNDLRTKTDAEEADRIEKLEEAELDLPPGPAPRPNPSKLRFAFLMVIAVYPVITVLLHIVMPLTAEWEIWQRTLVITPVMVLSIVFVVSPTVNRHFGWFVAGLPMPRRQRA
jgi:antibiotic biosynthesis monooxygenase (ABM) superfamily enzyme